MTDAVYFIDANVPMYAVGSSHLLKEPCVAVLESIAQGEVSAVTDVEVFQEIAHRQSERRPHHPPFRRPEFGWRIPADNV